jgi:transcriptional regulator with XRE-family HTH domain
LRILLATVKSSVAKIATMQKPTRIHQNKTPIRRHFIKEWAETRNMTQADLARELGVDKSQTSRWWQGQMPQPAWQERIAGVFAIEPDGLLRHPDQDWMARFFEGRAAEERDRIKQAMELSFPLKRRS